MKNIFIVLLFIGAIALSNAKPTGKQEARCGGGGYYGGGGGFGGGGFGGVGGAGGITGVQPLSDGSFLLYSGNQIVGRTAPTVIG